MRLVWGLAPPFRTARRFAPDSKCGERRTEPPEREGQGSGDPTPGRFWLGFRSAARGGRSPRSGRGRGRGTRLLAGSGSGFRSAARGGRSPRSGRGRGRGTRLPAGSGSGFRSAARGDGAPGAGGAGVPDSWPVLARVSEVPRVAGDPRRRREADGAPGAGGVGVGGPDSYPSWLGNRNFLASLGPAAASSVSASLSCERGRAPFHTFPPESIGSERSSLPEAFSC